jgi:oligopeptide transport system permease protein
MRGDLAPTYRRPDFTVNPVIAQGLPISAALGVLALAFAIRLGMAAGIVSAVYRGSVADVALMTAATIGIALPSFVIAGFAILLFVFMIPFFPAAGWGTARHLVLPAICLGAVYAAEIARITRTGMLDTLSQDYIRTARAKGLSQATVVLRHALPGTLLPVVSFLGPAAAGILTGSIVIEKIFAIPGLGWHFVQAALQRDYLLEMGLVLLYTLLLYSLNFIVDVSYAILDPRVELK